MATTEEILADYIEAQISTETVYVGQMPEEPDVVTVVRQYGAGASDLGFGVDGIQFEHPGIQVRCRGAAEDWEGPRARIEAIYQLLPKIQGATVGGVVFQLVKPQSAPFELERDDGLRSVHTVSFLVDKEPT